MPLLVNRLREIRKSRGWTQRELAHVCGLAENMIYRYENGRVDPTATTLTVIAEKLNVSTDYLLGLVDESQTIVTENNLQSDERDLVNSYRREGWVGVIRLVGERMGSQQAAGDK